MVGITPNIGKTAKQLAQDAARRMAREPLEVLKKSGEQVVGNTSFQSNAPGTEKNQKEDINDLQEKEKERVQSRYQALQKETQDIRRQTVFQEVQNKITQGEEVYLEDIPELSMEQRQVLAAQAEAQKARQLGSQAAGQLAEPTPKKGRRLFGFGQKAHAKELERRVEKPAPPSG